MKRALWCSSCGVLFLLMALDARATTFTYEQLPRYDVGAGHVSSVWDPFFEEPGAQVWDDFAVPFNATLTEIDWWGFTQYPPGGGTPTFSFTFYPDVDGAPGSPILQTSGSLSIVGSFGVPGGGLVYNYASTLANPFAAAAGTYWLSIFNESPDVLWGWQIAGNPGDGAIQTDYSFGWTSEVPDAAFRVVGTTDPAPVPECGSLALLVSGLVGFAGLGSKKELLRRSLPGLMRS